CWQGRRLRFCHYHPNRTDRDRAFCDIRLRWKRPSPNRHGVRARWNHCRRIVRVHVHAWRSGSPGDCGTHGCTRGLSDGDPNYVNAKGIGSLTITRATPVIAWPTPSAIALGTVLGANQLNATTSVEGTLEYTPGPGTVLALGSGHLLSVTFTPRDQVNYEGTSATVKIDVV